MRITTVLGTARTDNKSQYVAQVVHQAFEAQDDVSAVHVDVKDHVSKATSIPDWGTDGLDEGLTKWKEIAEKSDGFVFVLPEYNRGYPGEWKLLVDATSKPYRGKPVAIVGVSSGIFGGSRVIEHVKTVLVELGLVVVKTVLFVGTVENKFDKNGELTDEKEKERLLKFVEKFIDDVKKFS